MPAGIGSTASAAASEAAFAPAAPSAGGQAPFAVSVIAHELRAPLSSLAAASELLMDDLHVLERHQMRDMLQTIRDGTLWLQGLVENLLCATAIQAGTFRVQLKPLNLLDVALDVESVVQPLLTQRGQRLQLAADNHLPVVAADRRWLGQVLVNLIANASKYSDPDTPVAVRLRRRDHSVRVTVADRGRGLPDGGAARMFDPYFRGAGAAEADRGGVGLGLAIVKSVIDAHGGRVGAANRRQGGACVWFELDKAAAGRAPAS